MFREMLSDCVFCIMMLNTFYTKQQGIILIGPQIKVGTKYLHYMQARDLRNDKTKSSGSAESFVSFSIHSSKQDSFRASQTILQNNSLPYLPLLPQ